MISSYSHIRIYGAFLMSHPQLLWQVNKCLIWCISRGGDEVQIKKACVLAADRWWGSAGLQRGAVAAGVWAVPSLMAVTFLSSSSWLHCTAVDGACDSRAIPWALRSAPSEPSLSLRARCQRTHIPPPPPPLPSPSSTLMLPLRQQAHPDFLHDHLNIQKPQTLCWRTESRDHFSEHNMPLLITSLSSALRVSSTRRSQKQTAQTWQEGNRSLVWFRKKTWYVKAMTQGWVIKVKHRNATSNHKTRAWPAITRRIEMLTHHEHAGPNSQNFHLWMKLLYLKKKAKKLSTSELGPSPWRPLRLTWTVSSGRYSWALSQTSKAPISVCSS